MPQGLAVWVELGRPTRPKTDLMLTVTKRYDWFSVIGGA
jgi:hypothetical protein